MIEKEIKKYMLEYGYTKDDIEMIINKYPLNNYKNETLLSHIKGTISYLQTLGYGKNEIVKMTKKLPQLFSYSIDNIKQKINDLINLGYTYNDVIKMLKTSSSLFSCSIDSIKQKISDLINLGYTYNDVIKMTKVNPQLFSYSINNIKQKINNLVKLGYTHNDVIKMEKSLPQLFGYSIDTIKQKINDLIELGYTYNDVIKMTKKLPVLFGLSIDNIKCKIDFYETIGIKNIFIDNSEHLIQSVDLSYARYMFFKSKGIVIDKNNYIGLFVNQKRFVNSYGIDNKSLIEMYNYGEFLKERENERTI